MEEELVIRKEAIDFFKSKIDNSKNYEAIDDFHLLKNRLSDFYSAENKAIFLDEIEKQIASNLQDHRNKSHEGKPGINCEKERKPEKMLFYIRQELRALPLIVHQKNKTNFQQARNKIFVSYSHFDKEYLEDIKRHFKPFYNKMDFWDDTKILPGQKWKEEIKSAIDNTKVAILLVSTDFLGSDFIATNELPPLLKAAEENGAVILIVIVKPCLFEDFEALNQYQALNSPDRSIIKMSDVEKEELYVNLVRQAKRIISEISSEK